MPPPDHVTNRCSILHTVLTCTHLRALPAVTVSGRARRGCTGFLWQYSLRGQLLRRCNGSSVRPVRGSLVVPDPRQFWYGRSHTDRSFFGRRRDTRHGTRRLCGGHGRALWYLRGNRLGRRTRIRNGSSGATYSCWQLCYRAESCVHHSGAVQRIFSCIYVFEDGVTRLHAARHWICCIYDCDDFHPNCGCGLGDYDTARSRYVITVLQ